MSNDYLHSIGLTTGDYAMSLKRPHKVGGRLYVASSLIGPPARLDDQLNAALRLL